MSRDFTATAVRKRPSSTDETADDATIRPRQPHHRLHHTHTDTRTNTRTTPRVARDKHKNKQNRQEHTLHPVAFHQSVARRGRRLQLTGRRPETSTTHPTATGYTRHTVATTSTPACAHVERQTSSICPPLFERLPPPHFSKKEATKKGQRAYVRTSY